MKRNQKYRTTDEERKEMYAANVLETANTSVVDHIWRPVVLEDGKAVIRWYDSWRPDDFD